MAAGAVRYTPERQLARIEQTPATPRSTTHGAHDAHHVKYTLACVRAVTATRQPYAASWLLLGCYGVCAAWWAANPDAYDPLTGQAIGPNGVESASPPAPGVRERAQV